MGSIGVGLIGTGYMGKCHALAWNAVAPTFGDVDRPRLVHLGEANEALAQAKAAELGFARASGDWRAVIADPEVEIVSITTPNQFHAEMAIAALEAGKHVWCEKPMATSEADAAAMCEAARRSGKVAVLGYNYIQSPAIRQIGRLLAEGAIGAVNHVRVEMDEDFMADQTAPFNWKHDAKSGYGALDDFAVHPLSLLTMLIGPVSSVVCDMAKLGADRALADGGRRAVETHDIAQVLMRFADGVSGALMVNRAAWGRKGRLALQIFGSAGSILFDQERANEFQIYSTSDPAAVQGFRTVLTAPEHEPYGRFVPAPGHGLGFNDLKVIEAREVLRAVADEPARVIDFAAGLAIERTVHAMARSFQTRGWVDVA
ncbi:Glucose-fructose oxidoreductase precursor [Hartmannibacter diazotrophicus]|uniref:Glucose-fructose oxidoreductase n=1 Tax=Hartmannibacter diazotrophicus TaxID=1482074 RepID=A0A2C9DE99_9HYPH|nr:Gfo/Idh/MocA family oxidoreductase [Hartmannibacter diazotrophicus]SON58115.1 Glucose-fructose oxidoreductase precursor [Hartmannibacter diazotrophicus]